MRSKKRVKSWGSPRQISRYGYTGHVWRYASAWSGTGISYGYGLFDWGNGEFGHGGGMDGFGSEYWFHPGENVGFVLLTSSGGKWVPDLSKKINKILIDVN